MWARSADSIGDGYSPLHAQLGEASELDTVYLASSKISASVVAQDRDGTVTGQWYSDRTFFFNLSLTGRPASARGRFEAMEGGYRPVGDLFFIPAGQRYLARGGPGHQRNLFVEMYADERARAEWEFDVARAPVLQTCMNLPFDRLRDLLLRMAREVRQPGFASELLLEGLGVTLLAETLRVLHRIEANAARKGGLSPWRLRAIEARVHDGKTLPTITELAELCGLSRRQLMRAFREETGQTVGAFVQNLTLERAKHLLGQTGMSIAEIAVEVGFATAASFSTAFRRSMGESPRNFRIAHRKH